MTTYSKLDDYDRRSWAARASAAHAAILRALADDRDSGQIGRISGFLASVSNGQAFRFAF